MGAILFTVLAVSIFVPQAAAKTLKLSVRIVHRQVNSSTYLLTVPGYASSNCGLYQSGSAASVNCSASGVPARSARLYVQGATLSLLLPDKRIVVVSCTAKTNWTDWHRGLYRSCREPIGDIVDAEFEGDKAKLIWSVSLDGKKRESETYKITGVLSKMPSGATPAMP